AYTALVKSAAPDSVVVFDIVNLILDNVLHPEQQARFAAVRYATSLFPFSHAASRYVCLLASGDQKLEVRELARQGLKFPDPTPLSGELRFKLLPSFGEVVSIIKERSVWLKQKAHEANFASQSDSHKASPLVGRSIDGFSLDAYGILLEFLRDLMVVSADPANGQVSEVGNWVIHGVEEGDIGQIVEEGTRLCVQEWLALQWSGSGRSGIEGYLDFIQQCLGAPDGDAVLQSVAAACLLEVVSLGSAPLAAQFGNSKIEWFRTFLSATKLETRVAMARTLGVLVNGFSVDLNSAARQKVVGLLSDLLGIVQDAKATVEHHHGALIAIGFVLGGYTLRYKNSFELDEQVMAESVLGNILRDLKTPHGVGLGVHAALIAVTEIGQSMPLPSADGSDKSTGHSGQLTSLKEMDVDSVSVIAALNPGNEISAHPEYKPTDTVSVRQSIVDSLFELVKKGRDMKMQELAISTLSHLSLGDSTLSSSILDLYYSLATSLSKSVEVQFTVGESLTVVVGGWASKVSRRQLDITSLSILDSQEKQTVRTDLLMSLLERFQVMLSKGPAVRKA
ncbi:hypothetical protein HDU93_002461, partial [Gonapodya sp. JEL0774]